MKPFLYHINATAAAAMLMRSKEGMTLSKVRFMQTMNEARTSMSIYYQNCGLLIKSLHIMVGYCMY